MGTTTSGDPSSARAKRRWIVVGMVAAVLTSLWLLRNGEGEARDRSHGGPGGREHASAPGNESLIRSAPEARPALEGRRTPRPQSRIEAEADARESGRSASPPPTSGAAASKPKTRGTLLEHDGSPAAQGGVQVWIESEERPGDFVLWREAWTDDSGDFAFEIPPRPPARLLGWSKKSAATESVASAVRDGHMGSVRLQAGLSLSGQLRNPANSDLHHFVAVSARRLNVSESSAPSGTGRPGSLIECSPLALQRLVRTAHSDAEGAWRIEGLPPGSYEVWMDSSYRDAHAGLERTQRRVVEAPASDIDFDVVWSRVHLDVHPDMIDVLPGPLVHARLTDPQGRTSEIDSGMTSDWDSTRTYAMCLVPGTTYRLDLSANGYQPLSLTHVAARVGEEVRIPIRLNPTPRGSLRIEPPLGRKAREGTTTVLSVKVALLDRTSGEQVYYEFVDIGAEPAVAKNLPEGSWTLSLTPWGAMASHEDNFDLQHTQPITVRANVETSIRMNPPQGGRVDVRVRAPDRRVHPCTCRIERPSGAPRPTMMHVPDRLAGGWWAWSDALYTGIRYEGLEAFPPEPLTFVVQAPGHKSTRVTVRPEVGRVLPLELTLEPE